MRLIDADSLKRTLCKTKCGADEKLCVGWPDSCFVSYRMDMLTLTLDEAPTVDAVPVVRCKDCKYSRTMVKIERQIYADGCLACRCSDASQNGYMIVFPEHFCSYGVRKEAANDR